MLNRSAMSTSRSVMTAALAITCVVFITSMWHMTPWRDMDFSFTNDGTDDALSFANSGAMMSGPKSPPGNIEAGYKKPSKGNSKGNSKESSDSNLQKEPTFYQVAKKHGTDKVTAHSYHRMYQKYLGPIRTAPLKMLEIGLGCNMGYGPGKSYDTWLEWLPNVDLYFIEYDGACATKWAGQTAGATVATGDQANATFLVEFMEEYGMDFDIIIDDGGHSMDQQKTSINTLWQAVKPGGIYICEDLQTSYMAGFGGGLKKATTMVELIKDFIDDLHMTERKGNPKNDVMKNTWSVDCMAEICAFSKAPKNGKFE